MVLGLYFFLNKVAELYQGLFPEFNIHLQSVILPSSIKTFFPIAAAAAIGKKVFILLGRITDWRWMLNSGKSPWYSSATLLRKKYNPKTKIDDWSDAFEAIMKEFKI